jgi:manganese transport protein
MGAFCQDPILMPSETAVQDPDPSSSAETTQAVREVLEGRRTGVAVLLPFMGPAVVVSVAYMDPGNFATNVQADSY